MAEEASVIEAPPFEGTKDALLEHLNTFHSVKHYSFRSGTKTPKDVLVAAHDKWHRRSEFGDAEDKASVARFMATPHVHTAVTEQSVRDGGYAPLDLEKPLTAGEAKALSEIIDNDFNALRADMRAMASDKQRERLEAVAAEWDAKGDRKDEFKESADRMVRGHMSAMSNLVAEAKVAGVELDPPGFSRFESRVIITGRDAAIREAKAEIDMDLRRAEIALERQRLAAQRTVILARVTKKAQEVLDQIPDAKTLMVKAAQEKTAAQIER